MSEEKQPGGDIKARSPLLKKLDNYWYHYKWHSIIALFLVIVILVCSLQMCSKDEYDIEVLYAGPLSLNDKQAVLDIENAFATLLSDQTGDGKVSVNLVSYWVDESIKPDEEAEGPLSDVSYLQNHSLNNQKLYMDEIYTGNVSVFLVSPHLFYLVDKDDSTVFMRVTDVFPEMKAYEDEICVHNEDGKINRFGVVLSKTAFGQSAGLSSLPDDTILCLVKKSEIKGFFGAKKANEAYELATRVFTNALALGPRVEE